MNCETENRVFLGRHDIQHYDTQHNDIQQNDSIKGLFVTLSINDIQQKGTQHNKSAIILSVFMLSVTIYILLC
jgi:hypothetical protein